MVGALYSSRGELDFSPAEECSRLRMGFRVCVRTGRIWEARRAHRRSLRFATPDFLWNLVALVHFMRLSLTERRIRGLVQCSVAGNPGTLRSG